MQSYPRQFILIREKNIENSSFLIPKQDISFTSQGCLEFSFKMVTRGAGSKYTECKFVKYRTQIKWKKKTKI